jgi:hypothetical protein
MFIWLIIRLIQLVFSAGIVFFSHEKSANSVFQPAYNSSRTAPKPLMNNENKWGTTLRESTTKGLFVSAFF